MGVGGGQPADLQAARVGEVEPEQQVARIDPGWLGEEHEDLALRRGELLPEFGWQRGYGNLIKIQHELGTETRFAHLSKIRVKVGQKVSRGARIGDMGNTGRSTGSHLHYEVRVNGRAVDPMSFMKAAQNVF